MLKCPMTKEWLVVDEVAWLVACCVTAVEWMEGGDCAVLFRFGLRVSCCLESWAEAGIFIW
ncbi:hypothetical protein [Pedosphaera parvula]|uniref:Uncharacterized protein n=1 Tax=Pedosphaera parvula (strain Ellin514) TaxID=320771 RepID=B9XFI8_PEDPL|nr:hypothetical protein [Pedosphaera parvula]EEF61352.1 hypothetical protein Cflav_PD4373 [Pedosphaera parvula Ellin514]